MIPVERIHPCPLDHNPLDRAWLERQESGVLIAIIGQLAAGSYVWRQMLDEAIQRGLVNGLQEKRRRLEARTEELNRAVSIAIDTGEGLEAAFDARTRAEDAEDRCWKAFMAAAERKPGFHRLVKP